MCKLEAEKEELEGARTLLLSEITAEKKKANDAEAALAKMRKEWDVEMNKLIVARDAELATARAEAVEEYKSGPGQALINDLMVELNEAKAEQLSVYKDAVKQTLFIACSKHKYKGPGHEAYPAWIDHPGYLAEEYPDSPE